MQREPRPIDFIVIEEGLSDVEFRYKTDLSNLIGTEILSRTHKFSKYYFVFTNKMIEEGFWTIENIGTYDTEYSLIFKFNRTMSDLERETYEKYERVRELTEKKEYERLKKKFEG